MRKVKFYYCPICGNIVEKIEDSGNDLECCARTMVELVPGVTDGKSEWHVPTCEIMGNIIQIKVGQQPHPMEYDHYIQWIEIVTNLGMARKYLGPESTPGVCFSLCDSEKICAVYAYCNKHKLWKLQVRDM